MECHNFTPQMQTFIDFATYGPMIQDPLGGKRGLHVWEKQKCPSSWQLQCYVGYSSAAVPSGEHKIYIIKGTAYRLPLPPHNNFCKWHKLGQLF